jgi:hypothetical protein
MDESDSPVNLDEIIEQRKRELAELAELQRLAAKHNLKISAAQIQSITTASAPTPAPVPVPKKASASTKEFDGTVGGLIECYRADERSPYRKLKYAVRQNYESSLNRLDHDIGFEQVADLDEAKINHCYETKWAAGGKLAMGHNMVGKLRMLSTFGSTVLKDGGCTHLAGVLAHLHTKPGVARTERLTSEHVNAFRSKARAAYRYSIALAQALQFEVPRLQQLDIIGEWVPLSEPGTSDVMRQKQKWLRGLRWTDIDENLILRRTITKGRKAQPQEIKVNLNTCPMVLEELFDMRASTRDRSTLPTSGPIIVSETTGVPYAHDDFRRKWRDIANEAGVPPTIRNSDSIRAEAQQGSQRTKATIPGKES